ncbi:MAG: hypothetical protein U0002_10490 [Thermoanaerobaculia bacterium]
MLDTPGLLQAMLALSYSTVAALIGFAIGKTAESRHRKIHLQCLHIERLLERRHECYPSLFLALSGFIKRAQARKRLNGGGESAADLRSELIAFLAEVSTWDSKFALYLSKESIIRCGDLRFLAQRKIEHADVAELESELCLFESVMESREPHASLHKAAVKLELSLRADLGIYGLSHIVDDAPRLAAVPGSYIDASRGGKLLMERPRLAGKVAA